MEDTNEEASREAFKSVAKSVESFTIDFHKNVADKEKGNFISSALSAHMVLAMAAYGAQGTTGEQMRRALHLPEKDTEAHLGFQKYIDTFDNVRNVILKLANKIYINNKFSVKDEFLKITEAYFRSQSKSMDVSRSSETAKTINQWCVEKTNGKIKDIIQEDDVTPDLALVLLNAVYFKGNWKDKFDEKNTEMKPFNVDKSTIIQVPTMHIKKKYSYRTIDELNAQCIKLPYKNENFEMEIILPNEVDGLALIENNLEKLNIDENNPYRKREIILALPKFKVETTIDLKPHLTEMGMGEIFSGNANFKGIADSPLHVSKIIQKAFIEVNEEGSEAAAVTVGDIMLCKKPLRPIQMNVERPFIYRIFDKNNIVFSGRIINPLAK